MNDRVTVAVHHVSKSRTIMHVLVSKMNTFEKYVIQKVPAHVILAGKQG
ncbi:MAG: hypothetical protein JETT_1710 [Candidatus Jettenia ecosi]|uniref:Uncharacterized protein n=1 Tax=Candidatus Jettenia ecosi TaxID=2494326 RepID=A0A533QH67_9BACT|nr:MAG: hypothetical protein JETT_1710 [Candidatus Jettenia ecosi]